MLLRRVRCGCVALLLSWPCFGMADLPDAPNPCRNPPFCRLACTPQITTLSWNFLWSSDVFHFNSAWIPFGDHPLKLERYRED